MSDWDKKRAKYWEDKYDDSQTSMGCFALVAFVIFFILILITL